MPNVVKYEVGGSETNSIKKGNLWFGVGGRGYGPTDVTGFYSGISIPDGGYGFYQGSAGGFTYYTAQTDDELVGIANMVTGDSFENVLEVLNHVASDDNLAVLNSNFEQVVTDGLVLDLDAKKLSSFNDNQPTINLVTYPTMLPSVTSSVIIGDYTPQSNIGGSNWSWTIYPNSEISTEGGMEWRPDVTGPFNDSGAWLMKKRPGGNSESNWYSSPPGAIDSTKSYTISTWCKTDTAGVFRIHINVTQNGSSYWGYSSNYHTGDGEWQLLTLTIPANAGNTSINTIRCQAVGTSVTADAYWKYYQVEEGSVATPFVSGSRSQNTTWYDLSRNDNTGSLENDPFFNNGGWFDFDGTDVKIKFNNPPELNFTSNMSHEVWFWRNSNATTNLRLSSKGAGGSGENQQGFGFFGSDSSLSWSVNVDGVRTNTNTSITTGQWYHVVGTVNLNTGDQKIYLNGEEKNSTTLGGSSTMESNIDFFVGSYFSPSNPLNWDGKIGLVRAYSKVLSQSEINQNYYGGPIVTDGLVFAVDASNLVSYESGSTTTYPMTGSITGSLENGVDYLPSNGGTWDFDGTDDRIDFGNNLNFGTSDPFSVSVWFNNSKTLASSNDIYGLVNKYDVNTINGWTICLRGYSSGIMVRLSTSNNGGEFNDVPLSGVTRDQMSDGNWHNITMTYDSDDLCSVYVDGNLKGTRTYSGYDFTNDKDLSIGSFSFGNSFLNQDKISSTYIYDRALTADEVWQNYQAQSIRFN